jgi:hypothetical protein
MILYSYSQTGSLYRFCFRLYLQLLVEVIVSYLRYLCLFVHSGVQHILCCVFTLGVFVYAASFSVLSISIVLKEARLSFMYLLIFYSIMWHLPKVSLLYQLLLTKLISPKTSGSYNIDDTITDMVINLYLQLLVEVIVPYLRYLCLFVHSGVQHILCCVFVLFVFVLCLLLPMLPVTNNLNMT